MTHSYVAELAAKQRERGIVSSNVFWTAEGHALSDEERARHELALIWEIEQGHMHRVRCIDGFRNWRDTWNWIHDRVDEAVFHLRKWLHRNRVNPYKEATQ